MACSTGDACGFTETRSSARSSENQSAVIRLTIDALDAWWPPTFTPERFSRTRLAWWTIAVASQSTRRSTALSVERSGAARGCDGCIAVFVPLKDSDLPTPQREHDEDRLFPADPARASADPPGAGGDHLVAELLEVVDLRLHDLPHRAPLLHARPDRLATAVGLLLGPVRSRVRHGVRGVEVEHAIDVAGVPTLDQLA